MGDVGDFFEDCYAAVEDVFNGVDDWIEDAYNVVADFVDEYWEEVLGVVAVAVLIFTPLGPIVVETLIDLSTIIVGEVASFATAPITTLDMYAGLLIDTWVAFAEFTHLSTILAIHNVAVIISPEYQEMMLKLYKKIGEFSAYINAGAYGMSAILNNTRAIIFDAASSMGMSYDMCELTWFNDLAGITQMIGDYTTTYTAHPEQFITDLQNLYEKPAIDSKHAFLGTFFPSVEGTINLLGNTASHLKLLSEDVYRLFSELPEFLETDWTDNISEVAQGMLNHLNIYVYPTLEALSVKSDSLLKWLWDVWDEHVLLENSLNYPGSLLRKINLLDSAERDHQYDMIYEVTHNQIHANADENYEYVEQRVESIQALVDILKTPPARVVEIPTEVAGLQRPVGIPAVPRKSWNVGEF